MKRIRKQKNKGFSLIEVLLAVVILGLIATPILQMFISSYAISLKSKKSLAAADLSQTVLEYLSNRSFEDYVSTTTPEERHRDGLKKHYLPTGEEPKSNHVIPDIPTGETMHTPKTETDYATDVTVATETNAVGDVTYTITYRNVDYEGYKFNVIVSFKQYKEDEDKSYFTYTTTVEVDGADGEYFNIAQTEVVNQY